MRIFRLISLPFRLAWPHILTPWRSPLVRWRMETFGVTRPDGRVLHAEEITAADACRFVRRNAQALGRFLVWAARL